MCFSSDEKLRSNHVAEPHFTRETYNAANFQRLGTSAHKINVASSVTYKLFLPTDVAFLEELIYGDDGVVQIDFFFFHLKLILAL